MTAMSTRRFTLSFCVATILMIAAGAVSTVSPHFYRDDPIAREPESQNASGAAPSDIGQMYEMVHNLLVQPGYKPSDLRAQNLNTVDEVPVSSWFTNRLGATRLPIAALVRGPVASAP